MNRRPTIILAAHGAGDDSPANKIVHKHANRIRKTNRFHRVLTTFNKGTPHYSEILDTLEHLQNECSVTPCGWRENQPMLTSSTHSTNTPTVIGTDIIIVPLMTSAGYVSQSILPEQLRKNTRHDNVQLQFTDPVGTHPSLKPAIAARAQSIINNNYFSQSPLTIILVGHGTKRSTTSKHATESLATHLRTTIPNTSVQTAYLDDDPHLPTVITNIPPHHNILTIPFLIGGGGHALNDIPNNIGLSTTPTEVQPIIEYQNNRTLICDTPTGHLPIITDIILDLATSPAPIP